MRKIAAHRIVLPDGHMLHGEVVTLDEERQVTEHHPLKAEEAGVEWYPGEIKIADLR